MFCDAEASQKDWKNWKDFKRIVGFSRCFVTLKRVKRIRKTERTVGARSIFCDADVGQKDWENWKEFNTKNCQAQPMFWGAEAGQKDWENCKDFKRDVGLGRCIVTLKRVKKIGKTERTLKQLSGLVDVLWSEAGQKDWENWKDFIRTIGLGRCCVTLKRFKRIEKTKRSLKELSG